MALPSPSPVSLAYVDTEYSADCIEFCPFEGYQDIFICGTYQVLEPQVTRGNATEDDTEQVDDGTPPRQTERTGRLLLFAVGKDESSLEELQRIDTPAILDAKWSLGLSRQGTPVLAVGDAKGCVTIYSLMNQRRLEQIQRVEVAEPTVLCLSLDWSNRLKPQADLHALVVSLSDGNLAYIIPTSDSGVEQRYEVQSVWKAHDYEPWIVSFDNWEEGTVWSGGDDLKLKKWSLSETSMPMFTNKRFDAGVTTITSSPHTPHLIAVGSYDSHLRLYDIRNPSKILQDIELSGGIWRLRFHPDSDRSGDLLCACMHGGFDIIRLGPSLLDLDTQSIGQMQDAKVIAHFDGHTSLAYGADWCRLPATEEGSLIVTCSFYDHAMHLWRACGNKMALVVQLIFTLFLFILNLLVLLLHLTTIWISLF